MSFEILLGSLFQMSVHWTKSNVWLKQLSTWSHITGCRLLGYRQKWKSYFRNSRVIISSRKKIKCLQRTLYFFRFYILLRKYCQWMHFQNFPLTNDFCRAFQKYTVAKCIISKKIWYHIGCFSLSGIPSILFHDFPHFPLYIPKRRQGRSYICCVNFSPGSSTNCGKRPWLIIRIERKGLALFQPLFVSLKRYFRSKATCDLVKKVERREAILWGWGGDC